MKNRFQSLPFKCNLQRYNAVEVVERMKAAGRTNVEAHVLPNAVRRGREI